jgi:starvation-inducible DNA-binding protein
MIATRNVESRSRAVSGLDTPNDLDAQGRKLIANALNALVADAFALYLKTKNFHWHISGSHFRDYHLLLDEQADQIFAMTDALAERVRKLGLTTIRSVGHIATLQTIDDDNRDFVNAFDMLSDLTEDNKRFAAAQRAAHSICDEYGDVATASILEVFIDETERRTWFLYEVTTGGSATD